MSKSPPLDPTRTGMGRDHIPELDGFRGMGALAVLWTHLPDAAFGETMARFRHDYIPGEFALDLFLVMSGFLITRILISERERGVPLRYFLFRRMLRIFPVYFITIFALWPRLSSQEIVTCLTYTSNYGFMALEKQGPLEQTWSLAIEEHFYLLWPPLIVFLGLRSARRVLIFGVFPMAALTLCFAYSNTTFFDDHLWGGWDANPQAMREFVFRSSTIRFLSLGLGALLAFHEKRIRTSKRLSLALIAAGLFVGWAFTLGGVKTLGLEPYLQSMPSVAPDYFNRMTNGLQVISLPGFSVAFVVSAITWTGTWWPHVVLFRFHPFRWIGKISYGIYIFHNGIFKTPGVLGINRYEPSPWHVAVTIGVTILLAMVSYSLLEKPLLEFGKRFRHKKPLKAGETMPMTEATAAVSTEKPSPS